MFEGSLSDLLTWSLVALFGVAGALNFAGPQKLLDTYLHWNYPRCDRRVTGVFEIVAALLIAIAAARMWGFVLAGMVTFGGIVMLLCSRKYIYAPAGILLLVLLGATLLA